LKDLLNSLKAKQEDFTSITAGLASPQMVRSWSFGEVKNLKPLIIVLLNQKEMASSVPKFLVRKRLRVCLWK